MNELTKEQPKAEQSVQVKMDELQQQQEQMAKPEEYNTKLAILNTLLQQNGIPPKEVGNIEDYLNKISVNQIRTEEQKKAQQSVQAKMDELDAEKQALDELMNNVAQEVAIAQSGFRALYGIQGEPIENLGYPEQLVLVTEKLLENKDKLQNTNENTPDDVTTALRNKDGKISNESITFMDRILQSSSKIDAGDLIDSINAVKHETGFIDLGKVSLFLSSLALGTAIEKVIKEVKNMPKIK